MNFELSPNQKRIFAYNYSGHYNCYDKIKIWDLKGNLINEITAPDSSSFQFITFSPTEEKFITYDFSHLKIWDYNGNLLFETANFPNESYVKSIDFYKNKQSNRFLLTISNRHDLRKSDYILMNTKGEKLTEFKDKFEITDKGIYSSLDETKIYVPHTNKISIWDAITGDSLNELIHDSYVNDIIILNKQNRILTSSGKYIYIWDSQGVLINKIKQFLMIRSINLSPSEDKFTVTCGDIRIYDLDGNLLSDLHKKASSTGDEIFSEDGKSLISYNKAWDVLNTPSITYQPSSNRIEYSRISSTGNKILSIDDQRVAHLWDINGNLERVLDFAEIEGNYKPAPDNSKIVFWSKQDSLLKLWNLGDNKIITLSKEEFGFWDIQFSTKTKNVIVRFRDNSMKVFTSQGNLIHQTEQVDCIINNCLSHSPDFEQLLIAPWQGHMSYINLKSKSELNLFGDTNLVTAVKFSKNGDYFVTGGWSGKLTLWDKLGNSTSSIKAFDWKIEAVDISFDGSKILAFSKPDIKVFNKKGKVISTFTIPNAYRVIFSPNGNQIITYEREQKYINETSNINIRDIRGTIISRLDSKISIEYFPNNKSILGIKFKEKSVSILDNKGKLLNLLKNEEFGEFSPDGNKMITFSTIDNTTFF